MISLAYPDEGADVGGAPEPYYGGGGRFGYHLEGVIPLILIIVIAAVAGSYLGLWDIPFISQHDPIKTLIIGTPSVQSLSVYDQEKELIKYTIRSADSMKLNPEEFLSQFELVILDQSAQAEKYIPRQLGEALTSYVQKGGKLITVMNSGIFRKGDIGIVGWQGTFNSDVVPVDCVPDMYGQPSCVQPIFVTGQLWRADFDHPIMKGIEVYPALQEIGGIQFETFLVSSTGNEIAWIQAVNTPEYYPGIVEKRLLLGKSVYFNYDPGNTPGILTNALKYLR